MCSRSCSQSHRSPSNISVPRRTAPASRRPCPRSSSLYLSRRLYDMRKALSKLKDKLGDVARSPQPSPTVMPVDSDHLSEQFFAEQDIYRYRKQRGVNLGEPFKHICDTPRSSSRRRRATGSWFVLERWICEEPFRVAQHPAQSDLDIAKGQNAKEVLEHHWDSWISEDDWVWMAGKGINAVRIPVCVDFALLPRILSPLDPSLYLGSIGIYSGVASDLMLTLSLEDRILPHLRYRSDCASQHRLRPSRFNLCWSMGPDHQCASHCTSLRNRCPLWYVSVDQSCSYSTHRPRRSSCRSGEAKSRFALGNVPAAVIF